MKLNQQFDNLYKLPYYEYMYYLNLLIKESGTEVSEKLELERDGSAE